MHTIHSHLLSRAPATTRFSTLSLHDALPILLRAKAEALREQANHLRDGEGVTHTNVGKAKELEKEADSLELFGDRKSTRLNSSHRTISYAVFCLKKKIIYTISY